MLTTSSYRMAIKKSHIILKQVGQLVYLCHYSLTHAIGGSFLGGVYILSSLRGSTRGKRMFCLLFLLGGLPILL